MNKVAVALAADSAATTRHKIYNSVNKLFRLSDHQPVGIMIYGNAEIMGIPWEAIIKVYRSRLGTRSEKTLQLYAEEFVSYLIKEHSIFPDSERETYVQKVACGYLSDLAESARTASTGSREDVDSAVRQTIREYHFDPLCSHCGELKDLPENYRSDLRARYEDKIGVLITQAFRGLNISSETEEVIKDYCFECLCREYFDDFSGVVIAGFGEDELFPSLVEYEIEGMAIGNFLKHRIGQVTQIGFDASSAAIVPFAQKEMVHSFLRGIHPDIHEFLDAYLTATFDKYELQIMTSLAGVEKLDFADFNKKLVSAKDVILKELKKDLRDRQSKHHVDPVLDAVEVLPKDELAAMAESLVNLTVLKRRMSTDEETVGGPIDVAVISKGDGFIWIKRKHYFTKDLNPRYITQYFPLSQFTQNCVIP